MLIGRQGFFNFPQSEIQVHFLSFQIAPLLCVMHKRHVQLYQRLFGFLSTITPKPTGDKVFSPVNAARKILASVSPR